MRFFEECANRRVSLGEIRIVLTDTCLTYHGPHLLLFVAPVATGFASFPSFLGHDLDLACCLTGSPAEDRDGTAAVRVLFFQ